MNIVFLNYNILPNYRSPEDWLKKISPSKGIIEALSKKAEVHYIIRIGCVIEHFDKSVQYHFPKRGKYDKIFPAYLHQLVRKINPDIVIVLGFPFLAQIIQLRLFTNARIIVQNHGGSPAAGFKKKIQQLAGRCISAYFFSSKTLAENWLSYGIINNPEKIKEVMPASSPFYVLGKGMARKKTDLKDNLVYLWVGSLDQNKDPLTVIEAFVLFLRSNPSAKLYMIYHTSNLLHDIKNYVNEKNCENSIIFMGQVEHEELLYWFNLADFFISGSHAEVFGIALIEAMSCAVIPIVTTIPSFRKITKDGKFGLLYPPGDVAALEKVLSMSYFFPREKYADAVLQHFENELSSQKIADEILNICKELINK